MMSLMPDWLLPVLFALGAFGTFICLVGAVPEWRGRVRQLAEMPEGAERLSNIIAGTVVAVISGGLIFYFVAIFEWPKSPTLVWTRPMLSEADQTQETAECRKEGIALFGGGHLGNRGISRDKYIYNCLLAKRFVQIEFWESDDGDQ